MQHTDSIKVSLEAVLVSNFTPFSVQTCTGTACTNCSLTERRAVREKWCCWPWWWRANIMQSGQKKHKTLWIMELRNFYNWVPCELKYNGIKGTKNKLVCTYCQTMLVSMSVFLCSFQDFVDLYVMCFIRANLEASSSNLAVSRIN